MPKLTRQDWQRLKIKYRVGFCGLDTRLFKALLDKIYAPPRQRRRGSANPGEVDDMDALMMYLACACTCHPCRQQKAKSERSRL